MAKSNDFPVDANIALRLLAIVATKLGATLDKHMDPMVAALDAMPREYGVPLLRLQESFLLDLANILEDAKAGLQEFN